MKRNLCFVSTVLILLILISTIAHPTLRDPIDDDEIGPLKGAIDPPTYWSDGFLDDAKTGVIRDVVVGGGRVEIAAGQTKGIVSSGAIVCPDGFLYDWLVVEADTTGNSSVKVAVLNATETSQQAGYVNEPVPGFELRAALEQDLRPIDRTSFPSIRLQANLEANGSFRPVLLNWTVVFVRQGEWRDDFIGTGKLFQRAKIIHTNETALTMDLGRQLRYAVHEFDDYEKYPIIISNRFWHSGNLPFYVFYPNASGTGYGPGDMMGDESPRGFAVADLDEDGYVDLVVSNFQKDEVRNATSYILWGNESGRWSMSRTTNLTTNGGSDAVVGDFDCDGRLDIATLAWNDGNERIYVFMNPGDRGFGPEASIQLPVLSVLGLASGDINGDGYDDLVAAENWNGESSAYFGGPQGPDLSRDLIFPTGRGWDVKIRDLDEDGFLDVLFACDDSGKTNTFLGGPGGPDTTPDYVLNLGDLPTGVGVGDMNGDGYNDLLYTRTPIINPIMWFYPGSSRGWSDASKRVISMDDGTRDVEVIDLDKDGIDDAVIAGYNTKCRIHYGTTSGIKAAADEVLGAIGSETLCIGVPPRPMDQAFSSITSQAIERPSDMKWDIAYVDAQVPEGTSLLMDVLDHNMRSIPGLTGLTSRDADLSMVSDSIIHLRLRLISHDRTSTPVVNALLVNWMPVDEWREEFYGQAKTERLVGLEVHDGSTMAISPVPRGDEILIPSLHSHGDNRGTLSLFQPSITGDYTTYPQVDLEVRAGHSAVAVGDVDGDEFMDAVLASYRTSENNYSAISPLYLGTSVGFEHTASYGFPTTGASDVLLEDLNGDGYLDVVFAQERDADSYYVNSTLFWGNAAGWNATPDVEFSTTGASAVLAFDMDGDHLKDLVFACYKAGTTDTDSLVFLQEGAGFCGTEPSHYLATHGATGVSAGDLDSDGTIDLVFANSFASGFVETDSFIYWGLATGGFDPAPSRVPTVGASDVVMADVDRNSILDLVFANGLDDYGERTLDSYIYMNPGSRTFPSTPDHLVPTVGATAVAAADLDGTGWLDLVFACQFDGASYRTPSLVFLGGTSGYDTGPGLELPTVGASDVVVAEVLRYLRAGYLSQSITPRDPVETGAFELLRYDLSATGSVDGTVQVVDAETWEVLATFPLATGSNEVSLRDQVSLKAHPSIRVLVTVEDTWTAGDLVLDDLWMNWSKRVKLPPRVDGLSVEPLAIKRMDRAVVQVAVSDEFDLPSELSLTLEARLNSSGVWSSAYFGDLEFKDGNWTTTFNPSAQDGLGTYDLRVSVEDTDYNTSRPYEFDNAIEVLNNPPTPPKVSLGPVRPMTTDELAVAIDVRGMDRENEVIRYRYAWYRDGALQDDLTGDRVDPSYTAKGQNWSVEVRSFDGHDASGPATAWVVVQNSPPRRLDELPPASIEEDSGASLWLNLSDHFADPDGDELTWSLDAEPVNIHVTIGGPTGSVTIEPEEDWAGTETLRFVITDGEFYANGTGVVTVRPVDDGPTIVAVNGISVTGGVVEVTGIQDLLLVINVTVIDLEGDDLVYEVNNTRLTFHGDPTNISFLPGNEDVGVFRFNLRVSEANDSTLWDGLDFVVTIENANDPMDVPVIGAPINGSRFLANETFWLNGSCVDPDQMHGQVLTFTWTSNLSGDLGEGRSLEVSLSELGAHYITLTVDDGEHHRSASVEVVIYEEVPPPPPPPVTPDETPWALIVAIVLIAALALVSALVVTRRSKEAEPEEEMEEELTEEDRRRAMLSEMAGIAGEAADDLDDGTDNEIRENQV